MKERIPKPRGWLMIGTAILFDLIGIIPGGNVVVTFAYVFLFPIWFASCGVSFTKNKSMLWWTIAGGVIGFIPFLSSVLPELSLSVVRNVMFVQRQDKKAAEKSRKQSARPAMAPSQNNTPQNVPRGPVQHPPHAGQTGTGKRTPTRQIVDMGKSKTLPRAKMSL